MTHVASPSPPAPTGLDDLRLLPAGARLDEFEILRPLGSGGFGIVYLALDHSLLRQVALKEFMPRDLAARDPSGIVGPRSANDAEQFQRGLDSFFNEARLLARFSHPALVRVYRFWKANGTAYMAMQYCPGATLKEARNAMRAPPDEAWLRAFVEPILGALETLHRAGVFHRDISPDNILLLPQSIAVRHRQGNVNAVPVESTLVKSTTTDFVVPPEVAARVYLPVGTAPSAANVKLEALAT
jgi:serine/threonine protein kinase